MIEKGRISAFQMAVVMHSTILATAVLLLPSITAKYAKQDLWLSPIWASLAGFFTVWIAVQLNKLYPKESIVEYSVQILGKLAGKTVGFLYVFFLLYSNGFIVRQYAEFLSGTFLPQTPMIIVMGSMVLLAAYAVYQGLETIARTALIIVPGVIMLHVFGVLLILKDLKVKYLLPVLENGVLPSIMGAISPLTYAGQFILITFLLPFVQDRSNGLKWGMVSVSSVLFIMLLTSVSTMMLFGELTSRLMYPVMVGSRYISIADFLEHLEALTMAFWVGKSFIKISMFYYFMAVGTAQWLNLSDYRPIVLPAGLVILTCSVWTAPNLHVLMQYLDTSVPFYSFIMQIIIPFLLLSVALLRKRLQGKKGNTP